MKTGTKSLIVVAGFIIFCGWTIKQTNDIKKSAWLIGTWENKNPKGSIYEIWSRTNKNELRGKSYMVKEKDTIVFENIRLVQEPEGLFFIPVVKNQNNGLPVRFTSKAISEDRMIFENPNHDFPQVISYTKIGADSLLAEISGVKNGQERKETFPMKRVK